MCCSHIILHFLIAAVTWQSMHYHFYRLLYFWIHWYCIIFNYCHLNPPSPIFLFEGFAAWWRSFGFCFGRSLYSETKRRSNRCYLEPYQVSSFITPYTIIMLFISMEPYQLTLLIIPYYNILYYRYSWNNYEIVIFHWNLLWNILSTQPKYCNCSVNLME